MSRTSPNSESSPSPAIELTSEQLRTHYSAPRVFSPARAAVNGN
jgi:hypothetical protein